MISLFAHIENCFDSTTINTSYSHGEVKTTPPIIIGLTKVNRHTSQ